MMIIIIARYAIQRKEPQVGQAGITIDSVPHVLIGWCRSLQVPHRTGSKEKGTATTREASTVVNRLVQCGMLTECIVRD
jgi:hypothetical protein